MTNKWSFVHGQVECHCNDLFTPVIYYEIVNVIVIAILLYAVNSNCNRNRKNGCTTNS